MITQTWNEIITEIGMSRDTRPWLAVEGELDEKLLKNREFFLKIKIVVAHGWKQVIQILTGVAQQHHHHKQHGTASAGGRRRWHAPTGHRF